MSVFLSRKYAELSPYVPGEQLSDKKYIKLNTNESPFPPSKKAQKRIKQSAKKLMLYSDPECKALVSEFAKRYGVKKEQLIFTNGSDEVLNFAFMAYCDGDKGAVFPDITYGFYSVFAKINCVNYKEIPLKDDFTIDIKDYFNANGTVFIANPNAPTGIALTLLEVEEILKNNPDNIVVIDEAYVDFGNESAVSLIDKYDNLLVTQTFSKSRSLAGARLGVGIANERVISDLVKIKYSTNPYNVNAMTMSAGLGAIEDEEYFKKNCNEIIANREWVTKELLDLGFTGTKSTANFIFVKSDKIGGEDLYLKLKAKGILVRYFNKARIKDYIRITIGSKKQMQALVIAIKNILEELK